ncbi:hypothetical protein L9F63_012933, partial [Diploptera punctata]
YYALVRYAGQRQSTFTSKARAFSTGVGVSDFVTDLGRFKSFFISVTLDKKLVFSTWLVVTVFFPILLLLILLYVVKIQRSQLPHLPRCCHIAILPIKTQNME